MKIYTIEWSLTVYQVCNQMGSWPNIKRATSCESVWVPIYVTQSLNPFNDIIHHKGLQVYTKWGGEEGLQPISIPPVI